MRKIKRQHVDLLLMMIVSMAGIAIINIGYTFVNTLSPAKDVLAQGTVTCDISKLAIGGSMTVSWRGKPVFIKRRTAQEIKDVRGVDLKELRDPSKDEERVKKDDLLVVVGVCTHLGCVPSGQKATDPKGDYCGWLCPCHGSHYDASGRIRKGPAPSNLPVPEYTFVDDHTIRIGS